MILTRWKKSIRNTNTVTCKLRLFLIRATNDRLEVARKKKRKREEMMEKQKAKVIAAKRRKTGGRISLFSEKENESDTKDDTDPNQANDKCLPQL